MRKISFYCVGICTLIFVAGCWNEGHSVVTAQGTILLKGVPLDGANLTVQYADGNVAQDVSHGGGKFALTYNGKLGAVPGKKLRVTVTKAAPPYSVPPRSDSTPPDPAGRMRPEDIAIMVPAKSGTKALAPEVNAQYELTIPDGGSNALRIELP